MASQGDIVFAIGADISSLTTGTARGSTALASMEKAAKDLERQIVKIGDAGATFQREINQITGVSDKMAKSARSAADAFKSFDAAQASVNSLRASYDPLFAASQRYEAAVRELDSALEMGVITGDKHARMLDDLGRAYLSSNNQVVTATGKMGLFGSMSDRTRAQVQNVGYQVQDFAVQVGGGTSATQAFAQQFPQLASALGPIGVLIGTIGAVAVPLLVAAFGSGGDASEMLEENLKALAESVTSLNEISQNYSATGIQSMIDKYGELNSQVLAMIEAQRQIAVSDALEASRAAVQSLSEEYGLVIDNIIRARVKADDMNNALGLTKTQAQELKQAMADLAAAQTFDAQAAALRRVNELLAQSKVSTDSVAKAALEAESQVRQLAEAAPGASWMGAAIAGIDGLIAKIRQAVSEKSALLAQANQPGMDTGSSSWYKNGSGITLPGSELIYQAPATNAGGSGGSGGGGGGAKEDPMQARIDALVESLKTESEIIAEWYAQSLEELNSASDAQLAAVGGRHAAMERLETEHQARLAEIKSAGNQWGLEAALEGGAAILGAMSSTNAKAAKAQAIFSAGSALMSTYQGAAKELEKGTFGFASAAAVIAKGIGFVAAISNAGKSASASSAASSSGASSATSTAATTTTSNIANVTWIGEATTAGFQSLTEKLNAEFKQGYILNIN
jgi:hypothetical protein